MRIGSTEFDPLIVGTTAVFGVIAVGLAYLLRDILLEAPGTAFPLLFTVVIGGVFAVAWLVKRGQR